MLRKILSSNPRKMKKFTLRLLSLSVWGAPASLGTKDKTERVSFNSYQNTKGVFLLQNECKCNIPQIAAIAAFIANSSEYDLVLLQDLWMRPDHETIRAALPKVIHNKLSSSSGKILFCINLQNRVMTRVGDLAPALCDGRVLPTSCSGLALVSRCLKGLHHFRSIHFADML